MNIKDDDVVSALVRRRSRRDRADEAPAGRTDAAEAIPAPGRGRPEGQAGGSRTGGYSGERGVAGDAELIGHAAAGKYCCQAGGILGDATRMKTVGPGAFGRLRGCIWISRGRRLPLRRLQLAQAATMFSQTDSPPRLRGMTWSTVRPDLREPQYWQVQASRASTARRVILRRWASRGTRT